jgi:hypothetical protein
MPLQLLPFTFHLLPCLVLNTKRDLKPSSNFENELCHMGSHPHCALILHVVHGTRILVTVFEEVFHIVLSTEFESR